MGTTWSPTRNGIAWTLLGVVIVATVTWILWAYVGALAVGIFLYYAVRPVHRHIVRRLDSDPASAVLSLLVVGVPILLVLGYGTLVGVREMQAFLGDAGLARFRSLLRPYVEVASLTEPRAVMLLLEQNFSLVTRYVGLLVRWLGRLFVAFTVAYYLLRDGDRIGAWYRDTFSSAPSAITFAEAVDDNLTTIYTGNLITIGVTALLAAVVYYGVSWLFPRTILVQYPILLGLLLGVFTLVPVVGMKIIYVPYTLVLGYRAWQGALPLWAPAAYFLLTFVVIDTIPDIYIRSFISKGGIHMGLIMLTYVLSAIAFGWYGIFLGPIVLVFALEFARHVLPNLVSGHEVDVERE